MPAKKVKAIPEGYRTVTPYLVVDNAAKALEFYKKGLGATEVMRMPGPDGKIGHAEIRIGDSAIMLADEAPQMGTKSAKSIGGSPVSIYLYVEDCDAVFQQAVKAGGKVKHALEDMFYGDRTGAVEDPFGITWHVSTHKEDVAPEEMKKRMAKVMGGGAG